MSRTRSSKKKADPQAWLYEQATDVPRAETPDTDRRARWFTWVRRYVLVTAILFFPLALLTCVYVVNTVTAKPVAAATGGYQADNRGVAVMAVTKWMSTTPSPMPNGRVVSWEGVDVSPAPTPRPGRDPEPRTEFHHFVLADEYDRLYDATIMLASSPGAGVKAVGEPALIPKAPANRDFPEVELWPSLEVIAATPEVTTAVNTWVKSYTSGSADELRQTIGDPDRSRSYMPMSGVTPGKVRITKVAGDWKGREHQQDQVAPSQVVNVEFEVSWSGHEGDTDATSNTKPKMTFDLLVSGGDTASPRVVAWGSTGTGDKLVAYQNAVVGRVIDTSATTPTPAPRSAIPSPSRTPR